MIRIPSASPTASPAAVVRRGLGPLLPGSGLTLSVLSSTGRLTQVALDTGELAEIPLLEPPHEVAEVLPDGAGGLFVFERDFVPRAQPGVLRHVAALDVPPAILGGGDQVVPSTTPGRVWVLDRPAADGSTPVREVAADGATTAMALVPAGFALSAAVEGGLLMQGAGVLVHYDLAAGQGRRIGDGHLLDAQADRLARWVCDETFACWVAVGSPGDPDAERVTVAGSQLPDGYGSVLSPDGRWLATTRYVESSDRRSPIVLDLATGGLLQPPDGALPQAQMGGLSDPVCWAPSGEWLFVAGVTQVFAWQVGTDLVVPIDVDSSGITSFTVQ